MKGARVGVTLSSRLWGIPPHMWGMPFEQESEYNGSTAFRDLGLDHPGELPLFIIDNLHFIDSPSLKAYGAT
jgi:hypothetical protein